MNRLVSVIVPSYNSGATIGRVLDALLKQKGEALREVIVVDSSDDGTTPRIIADRIDPRLTIIRLDTKTIPAIARNRGAEEASGPVLAFVDADAYPASDWCERITQASASGIRAGGGSIDLPNFQRRNLLASAQWVLQFNEYLPAGQNREKTFVPSCNFFCDRELFFKAGGFPAIRASEDVLLGLRLAANGARTQFFPEMRVYHIFREHMGSYLRNQEMLGRYILIYRREHFGKMWYQGLMPILILPAVLAAKGMRIAGRVALSGNSRAMRAAVRSLHLSLLGLVLWGVGFARGCFHEEKLPHA